MLRRLAGQVDERQSPRTSATVNQMLDRYFEVIDRETTTVATYAGYADKHIRPLIGAVKVGALDGAPPGAEGSTVTRARGGSVGPSSL